MCVFIDKHLMYLYICSNCQLSVLVSMSTCIRQDKGKAILHMDLEETIVMNQPNQ